MIVALSFFGLVYGFAFPTAALAWDDCPKGLVNDPFPGECRRYEDTNGDGICDLSQPKPAATTTTTEVVASTTTTTTKVAATSATAATTTTASGEPPTGDCPLGPCIGCGACFGVPVLTATASAVSSSEDGEIIEASAVAGAATVAAVGDSGNTTTTTPSSGGPDSLAAAVSNGTAPASTTDDSGGSPLMTQYMVSPIAIAFFLIYGVSFILYKTKRIRIATHRKIWNVLLAATFLITGIFGLILTIQLDYELPFRIPFDLLFWHVEAGIVMTLISLFHLGWHFNYYRNLLRSSRCKARAVRQAERVRTATAGGSVAAGGLVAAGGRVAAGESVNAGQPATATTARVAGTGQPPTEAREQRRLERETRRSAAAARGIAARRMTAEPERAARAPHPWTEFEAE